MRAEPSLSTDFTDCVPSRGAYAGRGVDSCGLSSSGRIRAGKIGSVLKAVWNGKYGRLGKDAMREYKYYRRNKDRMKYDEYRAKGWFYGSGAVESGCKTVVGLRFKQSGMIWSLNGAKALLAIRTLYKSNRLEEFFNYLVAGLPQVACVA